VRGEGVSAPEILQWAPLGVQLVGFGIAYGVLRQQQTNSERRIEAVDRRLALMDAAREIASKDAASMAERMKAAEADILKAETQRERLIETSDRVSRELIGFRAASEEQHKTLKEGVESLNRCVKGLERQMANAAMRRAPFSDALSDDVR
jgi:alkylhydroperoxidase family enzyme